VHWASAAPARQRTYLGRMLATLIVGALLVVWLGVSAPVAGLVAVLVFALSSLVAYAANAKQVSKVLAAETLDRPLAPLEGQHGVAVLLVLPGEPRTYDGPAHWARRLRERAADGQPIPHWFMRPWAYGRIRRAYRAMGGANPQCDAIHALLPQLRARLLQVEYLGDAYPDTAPLLADELVRLVQQGLRRIVLAPVGYPGDPTDALRDEVTRTRVRGIGVQVDVAPPLEPGLWPLDVGEKVLDRLLQSEPLPMPTHPSEEQIAALAEALAQRLAAE
jgi:hypothetical protein